MGTRDRVEMAGERLTRRYAEKTGRVGVIGEDLLSAHHNSIDKTAPSHHPSGEHVHQADPFMVDGSPPLTPQIAPLAGICDTAHDQDGDGDRPG